MVDKIRAWLEEKSREAEQLFPKHGHLFLIIEDDTGDARERQIVSNMDPEDVRHTVQDMLEETGSEDREPQSKGH